MPPWRVYLDENWTWGSNNDEEHDNKSKPDGQKFFEAYAEAVRTRTFSQTPMTKWYSSTTFYRSETGKIFHGAEAMGAWMTTLFASFERVEHFPEYYLQLENDNDDEKVLKVYAGFRRRLWLKGNTDPHPDVDTPMAWVCEIGPADEPEGFLGLQFKKTTLYWDKTKTVDLLGKGLPSDENEMERKRVREDNGYKNSVS